MDRCKYKNLVRECFGKINNYYLKDRLKFLTNKFKGEIFLNYNHKEKFYNVLQKQDLNISHISPRDIAMFFLLTADDMLWKNSEHIVDLNRIDFKGICRETNTEGIPYTKLQKQY